MEAVAPHMSLSSFAIVKDIISMVHHVAFTAGSVSKLNGVYKKPCPGMRYKRKICAEEELPQYHGQVSRWRKLQATALGGALATALRTTTQQLDRYYRAVPTNEMNQPGGSHNGDCPPCKAPLSRSCGRELEMTLTWCDGHITLHVSTLPGRSSGKLIFTKSICNCTSRSTTCT